MNYVIFALISGVLIWLAHRENTLLDVTGYTVSSDKITAERFRILQISDFHNTHNRVLRENLISEIKARCPDIIVITGDLFDKRRTDLNSSAEFIRAIKDVAPIYYITGNHEGKKMERFSELCQQLEPAGINILRNRQVTVNDWLTITGVDSPRCHIDTRDIRKYSRQMKKQLGELQISNNTFNILLSHHPELFTDYVKAGYDLVFSGHAHGGQFRLPGIGGLFAPGQGSLPQYTEGTFTEGKTTMIVSRGIGNSLFPFRLNNHPELVITDLKSSS